MLQRSILYTLASFGRITAPHFLSMHMCKLSIQTLSTYEGEQCYQFRFMKLVQILLQMVNMLGQETWTQNCFSIHIFVKVVINYQKVEIEIASLVLDN
jgi:hypothetical protein